MADPSMVIRIAANIAELKKNLAEGRVQIETTTAAMSKLASSLSGEKLIQAAHNVTAAVDKIGGAGKLTRAEMDRVNTTVEKALEKYRALGQEAPPAMIALADATKKIPPELDNATRAGNVLSSVLGKAGALLGAFGVSLTVGAVVSFGKGLFDMAGAVSDLSEATGVSTTALQQFAYVGVGAGVSMEEIGRSVGTLSERLAGGDQSATDAVQKLGLSISDMLKAGPEEAFIQISEAVGRLTDPMQKNAIAADLFGGKLSKQLIPMLGDLRQAMNDVPKDALISPEQMKNADEFGNKIDQLTIRLKAWAATKLFPVRPLELQMPEGSSLLQKAQILRDLGWAEKDNWAATQLAAEAAGRASTAAAAAADAQIKVVPGLVAGYQQGADAVDDIHAAFKKFAEDGAEAARKKLAALKEQIIDLNQTTAKGLWAPKVSDMSDALDGYIADLKDAADQVDKIAAIQRGGVAGVWNIGVQLDTKDAQATLQQLNEEARNSLGGLFGSIVQGLPGLLQQAFTGGGGLKGFGQALTSQVGEALGSKLFTAGGPMNGIGNKLAGIFGDSFGLALPGIGQALGSLVGPIMGKVFSALKGIGGPSKQELEGRSVVEDFQKQFASVQDMVERIGAAYRANGKTSQEAQAAIQRMWAAEKLGAEATRAAIAAITEELKRQSEIADAIHGQGFQSQDEIRHAADIANAAYKQMLESGQYTQAQVEEAYRHYQELLAKLEGAAGEAARAWLEAHASANDAAKASSDAMKSAEADLKGLIDKRNSLAAGIAAEAPEAVMGVIEAQQRGQLAVLDEEIQRKADAYAQLADETGQRMADAIVEALKNIHIDPIHVQVIADRSGFPTGSGEAPEPPAFATEAYVRRPTLAMVGDVAGGEFVLKPSTIQRWMSQAAGASNPGMSVTFGDIHVAVSEHDSPAKVQTVILEALRTQGPLYEGISNVAKRAVAA